MVIRWSHIGSPTEIGWHKLGEEDALVKVTKEDIIGALNAKDSKDPLLWLELISVQPGKPREFRIKGFKYAR